MGVRQQAGIIPLDLICARMQTVQSRMTLLQASGERRSPADSGEIKKEAV